MKFELEIRVKKDRLGNISLSTPGRNLNHSSGMGLEWKRYLKTLHLR